jgi:mono/diheme cytochrome c family protein
LRLPSHSLRSLAAVLAVGAAVLASGCGEDEPDLANGKKLFVGEGTCGSCHALERAGTKGTVGPDLDDSFRQLLRDGMERTTIEGTVENQIAHPRRSSAMKPGLVKGQDARDVSAYVAYAAARPGKDSGLLASAAQPKKGPPIAAKGGSLTIPADPTGALAYTSDKANSPAGAITIASPNESPIQHNIALKPGGPIGPVVGSGGNSTFKVNLKAGTYTFYCSVPGHEQGGMKGTLTVK